MKQNNPNMSNSTQLESDGNDNNVANIMLARGIRKDNGEEIIGQTFLSTTGKLYIIKDVIPDKIRSGNMKPEILFAEIKPETLDYETKLRDESGKTIFDKDNVKYYVSNEIGEPITGECIVDTNDIKLMYILYHCDYIELLEEK